MHADIDFIVSVVLVALMILIPIIGLTARFSLKPIVEAIVRLRETASPYGADLVLVDQRFARLEAELQALHAMLEPIAERAAFDRQLYSGSPAGARHRVADRHGRGVAEPLQPNGGRATDRMPPVAADSIAAS